MSYIAVHTITELEQMRDLVECGSITLRLGFLIGAMAGTACCASSAGSANGSRELRANDVLRQITSNIFDPEHGPSLEVFGDAAVDIGAFDGDTTPLNADTAAVRRAKLGLQGRIWNKTGFRIQAELSSRTFSITDSYIVFQPDILDSVETVFRFGYFKPPGDFEYMTSSKYTSFMERSGQTSTFQSGNQLGFGGDFVKGNYGFDIGIVAAKTDNEAMSAEGTDLSARIYRTDAGDDWLSYFGVFGRHRELLVDDGFRYRARLPLDLNADRPVDTGDVGETERYLGVDMMVADDAQHVRFGAAAAHVGLKNGLGDALFWGFSLETGLWLTGETAVSEYGRGAWRRPQFVTEGLGNGGYGSLQAVSGIDLVDLTDGAAPGGRQLSFRVGLNWWPRKHVRVTANAAYTRVRDAGGTTGPEDDLDLLSLGVRTQFDF